MITVTLDAGHYGRMNRSPVNKDYYESERMWVLSQYLRRELESLGCRVRMTRAEQDKDLAVCKRGKRSEGTDLFLSLHSDACDSEKVSRVGVFYAFDDRNGASRLATMLAKTVADVMSIKKYAAKTRISSNRRTEYYGVMRGARNVGCPLYYIIEHGFHTNMRDSTWLMDDQNLMALARAEARTVMLYLSVIGVSDGLLYGFSPMTDTEKAVSYLSFLGYNATVSGKSSRYIATGNTVTVDGEKLTAVVMGDVNGDGRSNIVDYTLARRFLMRISCLSRAQMAAADTDGDGNVTLSDVNAIRERLTRGL